MERAIALTTTTTTISPPLVLVPGGRCQIANGQVGEFLGWTPGGFARVALDGELTISGHQRVDYWHPCQVRAVVLLPAP